MGIKSSSQISTSEGDQLDHLQAIIQSWRAIQSALSGEKDLNSLALKHSEALKLTQQEKDERDDAVKAASDAKAELEIILAAKSTAEQEMQDAKNRHESSLKAAKNIYDSDKTAQDNELKKLWDEQRKYAAELDQREIDVADREQSMQSLEKAKIAHEAAVKEFENEKAGWEKDFSERLAKLSSREQARLKS